MKRAAGFAVGFAMVAQIAFASDAVVRTVAFDLVHIRVPDTARASAWYVTYLGALPTPAAHRVSIGRTIISFVKTENAPPSTVIDHIGLSYADLDAKMKDFAAGGAKITMAPRHVPGLFKLGFIEDPWGVKIEVVEDPESLGFHHVHLRVPDPEATLNWFQQIFGGERGKLKGRLDGVRYPEHPDGYGGLSPGARSHGGVWVLALEHAGEALAPSDLRMIYNIGFQVQDLHEATAALKSKGVEMLTEPRFVSMEGLPTGLANVRGPDGVRIELLQRSKDKE